MRHLRICQRFLLYLVFRQFYIQFAEAIWPSRNFSSIQLLGLFPDESNTSEPTTFSVHSCAMFKAAIVLARQYNMTVAEQFIGWQAAQTGRNVIGALNSTCRARSISNIVGIVGPGLSREAHIIATFGNALGIPVVSYGATDPDLSDRNTYPAFYRTVPSDNAAAMAIVQLFIRFNWTSCIIIYQNDEFGTGGMKAINRAFINNNLMVSKTIMFDIATRQIRGDLKRYLSSSPTRIIILWVGSAYTSLVLQTALDNEVLGPQFVWILSTAVPLDSFNQTTHEKLIGMLTVEPIVGSVVNAPINRTLLNEAYNIWQQYEPESFFGAMAVNNFALFAFDATWLLIQSLQQLCSTTNNSLPQCISINGSSDCFDRYFINSSTFFDIISSTAFLGVSGLVQFGLNETDRISGTYYFSQNIQPSSNSIDYVLVLRWSNADNWKPYTGSNVIVWPGNSLQSPTGRALLSGVHLRIVVTLVTPFTKITNVTDEFGQISTHFTGYVPDLMELLQNRMGFIPHYIVATTTNMTYSDIIKQVENGVYDIMVSDVTITAARRETADFSSAIFDNVLRLIVRKKPVIPIDLFSYMKPFTRDLWLMLMATSICATALIFLFERRDNEALQHRSIISSVAMSGWYSVGTLMGYGADYEVRTAAGRLLTVGLYILSLVLVASYTANLASDLTLLKSTDLISGIDDIKNGKIPSNRIGIRVGTASEYFYLREISDGNRNYYPLKTISDLLNALLNGVVDVGFIDDGVAEYLTNNVYCNLTLVGAGFDKGAFGIVMPKDWIYAEDIDVNILSLKEQGALDGLRQKWFQTSLCPDSTLPPINMGMETMGGLFLTFAIISILSLILFAWNRRLIIKDYILTRVHRKTLLIHKDVSVMKRSARILKRSKDFYSVTLSEPRF